MTLLDEDSIIAKRILDGIKPDGQRTRIFVSFGRPYEVSGGFRCPVRITGLDYDYTPPDIAGWDAIQALLLAISTAASLLDDFVVRGGKVFYPDTETPYEFSDLRLDFRAPKQT